MEYGGAFQIVKGMHMKVNPRYVSRGNADLQLKNVWPDTSGHYSVLIGIGYDIYTRSVNLVVRSK